jgi:hypothetical protein
MSNVRRLVRNTTVLMPSDTLPVIESAPKPVTFLKRCLQAAVHYGGTFTTMRYWSRGVPARLAFSPRHQVLLTEINHRATELLWGEFTQHPKGITMEHLPRSLWKNDPRYDDMPDWMFRETVFGQAFIDGGPQPLCADAADLPGRPGRGGGVHRDDLGLHAGQAERVRHVAGGVHLLRAPEDQGAGQDAHDLQAAVLLTLHHDTHIGEFQLLTSGVGSDPFNLRPWPPPPGGLFVSALR